MTAIAAIADGTIVWMAGDSAGVSGYDRTVRTDPKVFARGPYVLGFTSSYRMGQLLAYSFAPPDPPALGTDLHAFMCTVFTDALRECFKTGGYATRKDEVESAGEFLVGVDGRLFKVCSDYQVAERADGYDACGCGEDYALGSLHTSAVFEGEFAWRPEVRLKHALAAAERFSTGVTGPVIIARTPGKVTR